VTSDLRLLTLDLETSPNIAHVWGLWKNNVSLNQLIQSTNVISFAAKWHGDKRVLFYSDHHDGHAVMIQKAHDLLGEADAVIHYNGTSFDMPHLNREFILAGMTPPAPYKNIDLLRAVRKKFRFVSNKLDYVTQALGLEGKVHHEGHNLWVRCMAGDDKAWAIMRKYNKMDVVQTEKLFDILRPWIDGLPNPALYSDSDEQTCERCGGHQLTKRGFAYTQLGAFQQWQCVGCKSWSRSAKRHHAVDLRGVS
jgi:DNA polymerase elongation subunit (family B)